MTKTGWKSKKCSMWKDYVLADLASGFSLTQETRKLSLHQARFEVYFRGNNIVRIRVRCRHRSSIYKLCQEMNYIWR